MDIQAVTDADIQADPLAVLDLCVGVLEGATDAITPTGRTNPVKTAKGTKIGTQFAVVEVEKLITSHDSAGNENPAFPQELQPRDRGRDASRAWVAKTANSLDNDSLGRTSRADSGAPIVGRDGIVESGNGRTMAIRMAYDQGTADEYRQFLIDDADYFGIDPDQVERMKRPVLVRVRTTETDRRVFTVEANQDDKLALSATERARSDSKRLDDKLLAIFAPGEDGDLNTAANQRFIQGFLKSIGDNEAAQYMTTDGKPTKGLIDRIQAAIFSKAYNDDRLLEMMADQTKTEIKNVISALNSAAPKFIESQAYSRLGTEAVSEQVVDGIEQSLDQRVIDAVIEATNTLLAAKAKNQDITEYVTQGGLFEGIDEGVAALAVFLSQNARNPKRIGIAFKAMAEFVKTDAIDQTNVGLFGDPVPPSMVDVVAAANREIQRIYGDDDDKTIGLFDSVNPDIKYITDADIQNDPLGVLDGYIVFFDKREKAIKDINSDWRESPIFVRKYANQLVDAGVVSREYLKPFWSNKADLINAIERKIGINVTNMNAGLVMQDGLPNDQILPNDLNGKSEILEQYGFITEIHGRWKYATENGRYPSFFADSKESAVNSAWPWLLKSKKSELKTKDEKYELSVVDFNARMDQKYGHLSNMEIQKEIDRLDTLNRSLKNAGQREFNGGGRRTAAAVSNEGARHTAEESRNLKLYFQSRSGFDAISTDLSVITDQDVQDDPLSVLDACIDFIANVAKGKKNAAKAIEEDDLSFETVADAMLWVELEAKKEKEARNANLMARFNDSGLKSGDRVQTTVVGLGGAVADVYTGIVKIVSGKPTVYLNQMMTVSRNGRLHDTKKLTWSNQWQKASDSHGFDSFLADGRYDHIHLDDLQMHPYANAAKERQPTAKTPLLVQKNRRGDLYLIAGVRRYEMALDDDLEYLPAVILPVIEGYGDPVIKRVLNAYTGSIDPLALMAAIEDAVIERAGKKVMFDGIDAPSEQFEPEMNADEPFFEF
jgi:hypothetical protein